MRGKFRRLSSYVSSFNLRPKLFFSHLLVALVGTITFVTVSLAESVLLEGFKPVNGNFGSAFLQFLVAGLAATVAATAASMFVAGRITEPLRYMLAATRRISTGRYGERVPVRENDELGSLSESFNAMAAALEETEERRKEFIADVSHELRTPLSTLQGYMEGLIDGVVEPSEETWGLMYAEAERMRRLVEDLRQLSRAETGELALDVRPISPSRTVMLATEGMLPLFTEKGVELENEVPGTLPRVLADADRVGQVLDNLLKNALRHTPAGGRVTVEAQARGEEVLFEVRDTGSGIASEHLPHVFERFYRVDKSRSRGEARGGAGVGLAISRALVEAMGGGIWVESAGPGEGTTFSLTLPVSPEKS